MQGSTDASRAPIAKLARVQLLILDDWGTHTLSDRQRLDLLEIFEERYRRKSTLITAQLPVAAWHEMIGDPSNAGYPCC
ncbi:ATP-binding protein [Mesorhizobium sp. LNHC209A00]|uniref:ATP-binding protein n=1 Tax=Mesorhizobium TaxID=68287 RepID=UPI0003FFCC95|nr:ATP-binding protein [Mesorhizobium sp. LNHC209A00]